MSSGNTLTPDLLIQASVPSSAAYEDVETLLKGIELELPGGTSFTDKDGFERHEIRIKWWRNKAATYADLAHPPYVVKGNPDLKNELLPQGLEFGYSKEEIPVLFGHYWFKGIPTLEAINVACLDYSVPRANGKLVAYRWSGEKVLSAKNFTAVANMADTYA